MRTRAGILILSTILAIAGCAVDPVQRLNSMDYEAVQYGPKWHRLSVRHPSDGGAASREGFMHRARILCGGAIASHKFKTTPFEYSSNEAGYNFTYKSFNTFGDVVCESDSGRVVAVVNDSFKQYNREKTDFFYLESVNLSQIDNNRKRTYKKNYGRGMMMTPHNVSRNVDAGHTTLKLVGRTAYAAHILTLTNKVYQVEGTLSVELDPYGVYEVKGILGEDYSAVWLEDVKSKKVVGRKFEIKEKGKSRLGILQK